MIYDEVALWGLTDKSSEQEIWDQIFSIFRKMGGRASIATVKDGKPQTRIISLQRMSDGSIYLMTSRGKPFYQQLKDSGSDPFDGKEVTETQIEIPTELIVRGTT